ncbi:WecB/TagA/CpsF family glycosyltransferase [Bhargavaea cecembensis]|uniref:WecB/TagA/CpsF family glycosyltransferase n=1 Tax=Bhargavaea cecembensis TaxID=394098 RepID=UPI0005913F3B|nr:WecB/TagA/CpsF family glycosyltransferase [Bhargavaea cecembensis]
MKEHFFGVQVNTERFDEMLDQIFARMKNGDKSFIVAINPEKLMKAKRDPELHDILNTADFQIPDGVGVLIASRMMKGNIRDRITGVDMMEQLCSRAAKTGDGVFLYGAKPGVAAQAASNLQAKFPGLQVAGTLDGYVKDEREIIDTINQSGAQILFVALGSPTQENFIIANKDKLVPSVFQGVGGSFDVFSGNIKRAPALFRKAGLEWLYRLLKEPARWRRQLELPKFLIAVLTGKRQGKGGGAHE